MEFYQEHSDPTVHQVQIHSEPSTNMEAALLVLAALLAMFPCGRLAMASGAGGYESCTGFKHEVIMLKYMKIVNNLC